MVVTIVIILYLLVLIFDFIPACKSKNKTLICVYGVLFTSSFIILFLKAQDVSLPTIGEPLRYLIRSMLKLK